MSFLSPCSACRRHVRADVATCPFCGAATPATGGAPRVIAQRLSRSALLALGASAIVLGCSSGDGTSSETDSGTGTDAVADAVDGSLDTGPVDTGGPAPAYGAPADTGTPSDGATDATDSGTTPDAAKDSGTKDSGTDVDGGATDSGGPAPAYGLPPPDSSGV